MKRYLCAVGAFVGTTTLVASSLLATAPSAHADAGTGTGTIVVNVIDQYGHAAGGAVELIDDAGTPQWNLVAGTPTSVDAGSYALESIAAWSGFTCVGVTSCNSNFGGGPGVVTTVVTINDGDTLNYTMHVEVPSLAGSSKVGSTLTTSTPDGFTKMQAIAASYGSTTTQWLRNGVAIPGATGASYTTTPADGSHSISARFTLPAGIVNALGPLGETAPLTTNAVTMGKAAKVKTKTTLKLPRSIFAGERVTGKVKIKARHHHVPTGNVVLTIGWFKTRKTLERGSVFITLPSLRAGTYKATVTYRGAPGFAKSKKKATLSVRR